MFVLINSIAPIVAGFCFFVAVIFMLRTIRSGSRARRQMYSFERQTLRQYSHRYGLVGFVFLLGALACMGLYGVSTLAMSQMPTPTPTPTQSPTPMPSPTFTVSPTSTQAPPLAPDEATVTPTNPAFTPSPTPTPTATPTPTPLPIAFINSPNGLYLREAPGGTEQVELLSHQSSLILLSGVVAVGDLVWQEVLTPAGNQGWVAAAFLIYPGTPTPEAP